MAEQVKELTGEALAAKVATDVMGWRRLGVAWLNGPHADDHAESVITFRPDHNIVQAWEVATKMGIEITPIRMAGDEVTRWAARMASHDGTDHEWEQDDSAPTAICRAAVAAVSAR